MTRIIRQNTKLTPEELAQYMVLAREYHLLYGKYNSRAWRIARKHFALFLVVGHGSTFDGFLQAKRDCIAAVRAEIEA